MHLLPPLIPAQLIRRYKRFLADFELENGEIVTAHCPNSGSMKGCALPAARHSFPDVTSRAVSSAIPGNWSWQTIAGSASIQGCQIGWCHRAIESGVITELQGYDTIRPEVRYGTNSRIDLLLPKADQLCYVEVKNVTLLADNGRALFPDAATVRGQKHLRELMEMVRLGHRAVNFFVVQRPDCQLCIAGRCH